MDVRPKSCGGPINGLERLEAWAPRLKSASRCSTQKSQEEIVAITLDGQR